MLVLLRRLLRSLIFLNFVKSIIDNLLAENSASAMKIQPNVTELHINLLYLFVCVYCVVAVIYNMT